MLMSGLKKGRQAQIKYLDGHFRLISRGDHVICAISGKPIDLESLHYWSVERQEAYASAYEAEIAFLRHGEDKTTA
ncbi:DUF2093 domain-containing protein [Zymomonas mobilis]|uniref:DUF2093 domain-containing protein n=1 Tax=Zymomonas mobilis subsp. pomaceae (strain ATCC 29192 / DSM 22645 / JCM 10191 / CCUG 17912 / NBRC 13757 / NCIMB 11200 / NRRL B-4491 / Barker I) TaxID=579138 RepID=F8EW57_ZYMMT|nr:DUF2093 domain-containing protein [Zymomonas mobilis]AEI38467.1 Protein of unknown function DUF2093 [Zymomonas mobilis subsp. pomaceae ATCC 29192]MDX5948156.1 DUF2093 domain-containing protein [Zymomonas mobilis subsp. pomaceae]GEB89904.1 hypothetical protein ZMO02_15410 [Zymomonas mobilis subsp. pomaceae]